MKKFLISSQEKKKFYIFDIFDDITNESALSKKSIFMLITYGKKSIILHLSLDMIYAIKFKGMQEYVSTIKGGSEV